MTPRDLLALKIGQPIAMVRDDMNFRIRRYAKDWMVAEVTATEVRIHPITRSAYRVPRSFSLTTGLGLKGPYKGYWLESLDDLEVMTETQPRPYDTSIQIAEYLKACKRWPSWASNYRLNTVSRWCDFYMDPISESSPERKAWMAGEKDRLERVMTSAAARIARYDKRDSEQ